jgi:hypothetical protein
MEDFLTPEEQDLLVSFNENKQLKEVIKKALTISIYECGTIEKGKKHSANVNWALGLTPSWNATRTGVSPEEVGKELMLKAEALAQVEDAFSRIEKFQKVEEKEPKENKAR